MAALNKRKRSSSELKQEVFVTGIKRGIFRNTSDWSGLHQDLLEIIFSKLPCIDVQRVKSVCSSWRAVAETVKTGPLMVLPSTHQGMEGQEIIRLGIFSVRDNTTYDLKLNLDKSKDIINEPECVRFVGSSHGWIILLDSNSEPFLWNLFSNIPIELPGKSTIMGGFVNFGPASAYELQRTLIKKAILTGNPSCSKNYKVVIIYDSCEKLAFFDNHYETWTPFSDSQGYCDIIWSNGMLYALRGGVTIEGWQFSDGSCDPTRKMFIPCSFSTDYVFSSDRVTTEWFLVPSILGDILFIVRYIGEFVNGKGELLCEGDLLDDENCYYTTFKFQVYKLDVMWEKLVEVKSLPDQVIFVGGNHGISIPCGECQGFKANSIYFTDDYTDRMYEDYTYGGHDIGVFSLEDESVGSVYESDFVERFEPIPFWVHPN